jgi:hypothetical protein
VSFTVIIFNTLLKFFVISSFLGITLTACSPASGNPPSVYTSTTPVAQAVDSVPLNSDGQKFKQIRQTAIAQNLSQKSMSQIMQIIAQQFLGAQYKAGLLDQTAHETLVASLTQFDCLLFVETVLALSRGIAKADYTYLTFTQHIVEQRYRQGQIGSYCDRLHYFSEWIADNQKSGTLVNLTPKLGGIPFNKKLNFMTTHRSSYPQLVNHEANYQCIAKIEQNLSTLHLTYIPTNRLKSIYPQLESGDIIGITTKIAGLDVTHTGLVYRQGNQVGFIHASPIGRVTIATDLQQYVRRVPQAIGIFVVRPLDPR